jgi:hypothetical protein
VVVPLQSQLPSAKVSRCTPKRRGRLRLHCSDSVHGERAPTLSRWCVRQILSLRSAIVDVGNIGPCQDLRDEPFGLRTGVRCLSALTTQTQTCSRYPVRGSTTSLDDSRLRFCTTATIISLPRGLPACFTSLSPWGQPCSILMLTYIRYTALLAAPPMTRGSVLICLR